MLTGLLYRRAFCQLVKRIVPLEGDTAVNHNALHKMWNGSQVIQKDVMLSLSTVVLNSRDWSEIIWLLENLHFKNQPCNRLYLKKPAGMHLLGYDDAVSWSNEAKTRIFQPTANFENFEINLYFVCLPACHPVVRPGCARYRAPEISHDKGNGGGFTKILFQRRFTNCTMAISFILLSPSLFF